MSLTSIPIESAFATSISDQQQPWFYLAPFRRYGHFKAEMANFLDLLSLNAFAQGDRTIVNFGINLIRQKLDPGAIDRGRFRDPSLRRFDTIPARDRQTDRQMDVYVDRGYYSALQGYALLECYKNQENVLLMDTQAQLGLPPVRYLTG